MKKYIVSYESGSFIISKDKKLICVGNNDLVYNIKDPGITIQEVDLEKICRIGGLKKENFIVESLSESFTSLIINGYTFKFNLIPYKVLLQLEYEFERHPLCQILRAFFRQNFPKIKNASYPYFIEAKKTLPEVTSTPSESMKSSMSSKSSGRSGHLGDKMLHCVSLRPSGPTDQEFLSVRRKNDPNSHFELNLNGG